MDHAENELLTKVGPGTAAGETLRKYWLPVGLSNEIDSNAPKLVRWLGEDLLFRDEFGRQWQAMKSILALVGEALAHAGKK